MTDVSLVMQQPGTAPERGAGETRADQGLSPERRAVCSL